MKTAQLQQQTQTEKKEQASWLAAGQSHLWTEMQNFSMKYLLAIISRKCTKSIYQYKLLQQIKGENHMWMGAEHACDKIQQPTLIKTLSEETA